MMENEHVIAQDESRSRIRRTKYKVMFVIGSFSCGDTSSENWRDDNYECSFAVLKPDRWARKLPSAKECVTTHLSNGRMLCHVLRIPIRHPITFYSYKERGIREMFAIMKKKKKTHSIECLFIPIVRIGLNPLNGLF